VFWQSNTVLEIPVAVQSKVNVCGLFIAGLACSNPAEHMDVSLCCFFLCRVDSVFCDGMITRSEEPS
jgi:hypothetical protein